LNITSSGNKRLSSKQGIWRTGVRLPGCRKTESRSVSALPDIHPSRAIC
jgi:hypothetical protein